MLSRRARSAIAAMLDIARLARGKPLPAKALAAQDGIAPRQFETVLQDLVRAGLLRSVRGPRGGYELARERRRIGIGDIVRAIEPAPVAPRQTDPVAALIAEAANAFLRHLDGVTIEDLCRQGEAAEAERGPDADFHI